MDILIVAAGTGGHVYPALSVAREFSNKDYKVFWLGGKNSLEERLSIREDYTFFQHTARGFRGKNILMKIAALFSLFFSFLSSVALLKRINPAFVFTTGNYSSLGPSFAAIILKIPLFIHEQNSIPGSANKILNLFSDFTFEGFKASFTASKKVKHVGNPVRLEFQKKKSNLPNANGREGIFSILILGGSQGSSQINQLTFKAISRLSTGEQLFIHHQSGQDDQKLLDKQYSSLGINYQVESFIEDISGAISEANLIISRAGAMTISEIAYMSKASILIPLPWSIDNHQVRNAEYFEKLGGALVINESGVNENSLLMTIEMLMIDRNKLAKLGKLAYLESHPDSSHQIFKYINESISD